MTYVILNLIILCKKLLAQLDRSHSYIYNGISIAFWHKSYLCHNGSTVTKSRAFYRLDSLNRRVQRFFFSQWGSVGQEGKLNCKNIYAAFSKYFGSELLTSDSLVILFLHLAQDSTLHPHRGWVTNPSTKPIKTTAFRVLFGAV